MDEFESLSHTKVQVQIPRRVHSEVPPQSAVRAASESSWGIVPQVSNAKAKPDR
jgi:hypothetical protein